MHGSILAGRGLNFFRQGNPLPLLGILIPNVGNSLDKGVEMTNGNDKSSFQPVAPQATGELLYGRFGKAKNHMQANWKAYATVAVIVLVVWWAWKKFA